MKTSIIIPTFNKLEFTKLCLESVHRFTSEEHEIIVIINGSTDDSLQYLKKNYPDLKLIVNQKNQGFPKACNQGMAAATGDNIVLLSNDVIVTQNWLTNLLTCLYHKPEIGMVGPVSNFVSGPQKVTGPYKTIEEMYQFAKEHNKQNPALWRRTLRLVGFCFIIKRTLLETIGMLDEQFGTGNYEDDDYCIRTTLAGYHLYIAGDVFVHHFGSISFSSEEMRTLLTQNKYLLEKKYGIQHYGPHYNPDILSLLPTEAKTILDINCSIGQYSLELKHKHLEVVGVEPDPFLANLASLVLDKVLIGHIEQLIIPYLAGYFDVILFLNRFSTLKNPVHTLNSLKKLLSPSGVLILRTTNPLYFPHLLNYCRETIPSENGYSATQLNSLLQKANLKSINWVNLTKPLPPQLLPMLEDLATVFTNHSMDGRAFLMQAECIEYVIVAKSAMQ